MRLLNPLFAGGFALAFLISLAALAFNIWMLVDAVRRPDRDFSPPGARVWWIVGLAVSLALGWIGLAVSLVYFFVVRRPLMEGRAPSPLLGGASSGGGGTAKACTNCGRSLGSHARYCQNCGTPVGEA